MRTIEKDIPHLPTSLLNIDLQDEWTQTTAAERFLLINDGTFDKILVFATDSNLQHLANNDNNTIYADGTFYTCPSIFEQLYTLHALIDGEMFPLFCTFTWKVRGHLYQILLTTEDCLNPTPDSSELHNFLHRLQNLLIRCGASHTASVEIRALRNKWQNNRIGKVLAHTTTTVCSS
ncbi:unnamed protein product [Mytilus edulis]|uniref:MULE transposase domain-containing protein n=1 Tax=Mytilus edulis TaxID=6550 RepID=A0A8S3T9F3_MYTED|nr:unnamed protein product [Mytilus edulis]